MDLDTYKTAYGKLHEEPLSLAVRQRLADVGIPPGSRCHQAALIRLRCLKELGIPEVYLLVCGRTGRNWLEVWTLNWNFWTLKRTTRARGGTD